VLLCIAGLLTTTAAQTRRRPSTGPDPLDEIAAAAVFPNFQALGRAAEAFAKAKEASAQASREVAASRQAFWAQYPNGPRLAEARATFAHTCLGRTSPLPRGRALSTVPQPGQP
jgi:hypothetical protein